MYMNAIQFFSQIIYLVLKLCHCHAMQELKITFICHQYNNIERTLIERNSIPGRIEESMTW